MIEEKDLRTAFARHESLTPDAGPLRLAIDRAATRRRRRRNGIRMGAAALTVLAGLTIGVPLMRQPSQVASGSLIGGQTATPGTDGSKGIPAGPFNFLLLGVEGSLAPGYRADSVMIVHVPADRSRLYLVSLPRDIAVPVPGRGEVKLNKTFEYGAGSRRDLTKGAQATARAVTTLTGVRIDGSAVLTFAGLRAVTDALGGVQVCLPAKITSRHTGRTYPAGCQNFAGPAALDLLRQRYGMPEGSSDRDRTAQRFTTGLIRRATERQVTSDPSRVFALLKAAGAGVVVDSGDLPLPALVETLVQTGTAEPVGVTLPMLNADGWHYEGREAKLAGELFVATRNDELAEWANANPQRVTTQR